jgi:hypothetical protein
VAFEDNTYKLKHKKLSYKYDNYTKNCSAHSFTGGPCHERKLQAIESSQNFLQRPIKWQDDAEMWKALVLSW